MTVMAKKNRSDSQAAASSAKPNRLADYFWANVIFFAFLFILSYVVRVSCEATGDEPAVTAVLDQTFQFFMLLLGGGFLVVTLFDAGYETFAAQAEQEGVGGAGGPA